MINKKLVGEIINELIADKNLFIVDITVSATNIITILIDSMEGVNLETCIILTKEFESKLDREIEDYELQVASAGIGQPFLVSQQYEKNLGNEVEVLSNDGKKYKGILKELIEGGFVIEYEEKEKIEGKKKKVIVEKQMNFKIEGIKYIKDIVSF